MNTEDLDFGKLDASVQAKLDADADFQSSLEGFSTDEEKEEAISTKKRELLDEEIKNLSKNAKLADNYKTRAEKAEGKLKEVKPKNENNGGEPEDKGLSTDDVFVLVDAKVPREDIEEVKKASKLLGKTIAEALQDPMVISILNDRKGKRDTAKASNTNPARPGQRGKTDQQVLEESLKGNIPAKGSAEAEALFRARRGLPPLK